MPGLQFHVKKIEQIIEEQVPELNDYLVNDLGLASHQIYLHDWIICLFTSIMPIERNLDFLAKFVDEGWEYFYKMSVAILRVLEPWLLNQTQIDQCLWVLKFREITQKRLETLKNQDNSDDSPRQSLKDSVMSPIKAKEDEERKERIKIENLIETPRNPDLDTFNQKMTSFIKTEQQNPRKVPKLRSSLKKKPSFDFDEMEFSQTEDNVGEGTASIERYVDRLKADSVRKNKEFFLDEENERNDEIKSTEVDHAPFSKIFNIQAFHSLGKNLETRVKDLVQKQNLEEQVQEENFEDSPFKKAKKKIDIEQSTADLPQSQNAFSLFKSLASNIQRGIQNLGGRKSVEADKEKYQDLANLKFDEIWDQVFEEIENVKIDFSKYDHEQISEYRVQFTQESSTQSKKENSKN